MLTGRKLALTLAFTALITLAFGVSCTGFFPPNTLTAVTIQPPSPQVEVGTPQTLQAWGTYQDGTRAQITSGVQWTSSDSTVLQLGLTTGLATGIGTGGDATVTAAAQGLSGTASATVYLGTLTSFEVCMGTFGATTSCSNGSSPLIWDANASGTPQSSFVAQGVSGGTTYDFTTASTWTVVTQPANGETISCTNDDVSPETCTVGQNATAATYVVTVTYGTTDSATLNIVVTN